MAPYGGAYIVRNGALERAGRTPIGLDTGFVPGVTRPFYEPTLNLDGAKNIGNLPGVNRAPYGVTPYAVTQITASQTNKDFTNSVIDVRSSVDFNNCRFLMEGNDYVIADTIRGMIRVLNGTPGLVRFFDCEIHARAQRVFAALIGRNVEFHRTVITGGVDGPDDNGVSGGAPYNFGFRFYDSWVGDSAWWRAALTPVTPTTNSWEGHGRDHLTHNDTSQITSTLGSEWHNTTLISTASQFVGTGTNGAGSDAGNSYVPSSGQNYIYTQAVQNGFRAESLNVQTDPTQSMDGISRLLSTTGSWACIMGNNGPLLIDHCWFDGGLACINLADDTGTMVGKTVTITNSTFWNGMVNGHGGNPLTKGHAVLARLGGASNGIGTGLVMPTTGPTANHWFDGGIVSPTWLA